MKRKWPLLITLTVLALIVAFFVIRWVFEPMPSSVGKTKASYDINAAALVKEFIEDEGAANTKYLNRVIQVNGSVNHIADDETVMVITLKEPGMDAGVLCSFDKSILSEENFRRGDKISVKGICTGYLLDVIMTRCSIAD